MKLIVISNPVAVAHEASIINALFDAGLELFHLRKPGYSESEYSALLQEINTLHYSKIALHNHHDLAETFGIKRIHFSEAGRLKTTGVEFKKTKDEGFILSTSVHTLHDWEILREDFSYTFYGPVFESISKPGYKPGTEKIEFAKNENRATKIIAIGGITPDKINVLEETGFDGAALLGAIWDNTKNSIEIFKKCNNYVHTF